MMKRIAPTEIRAAVNPRRRVTVNKAILSGPTLRIVLATLTLAVWSSPVFAQGSERVVSAKGYLSVDFVHPGDKFKVAVALEVANGYHINAHRPSLDTLIATEV